METLAFLLLVTMQRNNTGVASVSMEISITVANNDGLQSNPLQYICVYKWKDSCITFPYAGTFLALAWLPDKLVPPYKIWGFTAVTMKKAVFWDIKPSSYLTRDTLRLCYRSQLVNAM
jgi:hypothetical protein